LILVWREIASIGVEVGTAVEPFVEKVGRWIA